MWEDGGMKAERTGKSHGVAWVVCIILALPIFYRLSVKPLHLSVHFLQDRHDRYYWQPAWLESYEAPAQRMDEWPLLREAFAPYDLWVGRQLVSLDVRFDPTISSP